MTNPHPTPLRGATFSHEWEKDLPESLDVFAPLGRPKSSRHKMYINHITS